MYVCAWIHRITVADFPHVPVQFTRLPGLVGVLRLQFPVGLFVRCLRWITLRYTFHAVSAFDFTVTPRSYGLVARSRLLHAFCTFQFVLVAIYSCLHRSSGYAPLLLITRTPFVTVLVLIRWLLRSRAHWFVTVSGCTRGYGCVYGWFTVRRWLDFAYTLRWFTPSWLPFPPRTPVTRFLPVPTLQLLRLVADFARVYAFYWLRLRWLRVLRFAWLLYTLVGLHVYVYVLLLLHVYARWLRAFVCYAFTVVGFYVGLRCTHIPRLYDWLRYSCRLVADSCVYARRWT